jgi:hypothetical protein
MAKKFRAQIEDIADLTAKQLAAVVVDSVQDVLDGAQTPQLGVTAGGEGFVIGKIPVAEKDLIQSLEVGYNGAYEQSGADVSLSAAQFSLGDTINARWTAAHALPMELGFTTRNGGSVEGRHFLGYNAAKFAQFVKANAQKYKV